VNVDTRSPFSIFLSAFVSKWEGGLLGDKMHSMIFDNKKIKSLVTAFKAVIPFHQGAEDGMARHDSEGLRPTGVSF